MTSGYDEGRRAEIAANLDRVEARIAAACRAAGRDRAEITLVAVTKTFPADDVGQLAALGVREVGENRAADAAEKVAACREAGLTDLTWHFVGQVQTNKAALVAGCCDVVHSVDRARLVTALDKGAAAAGPPASGAGPGRPRGHRRPWRGGAGRRTRDRGRRGRSRAPRPGRGDGRGAAGRGPEGGLRAGWPRWPQALRREHPGAVVVSAGMSGDLEAAVARGATHLRVGTALLGSRPPLR